MRWFPLRRGLICGMISAVFGSGPFLFDSIQAKLVNPGNIPMNPSYGYAAEFAVVERIPFMFAYVAAIMLTMQSISILCIRSPPWFNTERETNTKGTAANNESDGRTAKSAMSRSQLLYESNSLTLSQTVTFVPFWILWSNNFLFCVVLMFMTSMWKCLR
jgi:hypothetical protein